MVTEPVNLTWSGAGFLQETSSFSQSPPSEKLISSFIHSVCIRRILMQFVIWNNKKTYWFMADYKTSFFLTHCILLSTILLIKKLYYFTESLRRKMYFHFQITDLRGIFFTVHQICRYLISPHITNINHRGQALTSKQILCVALRYLQTAVFFTTV